MKKIIFKNYDNVCIMDLATDMSEDTAEIRSIAEKEIAKIMEAKKNTKTPLDPDAINFEVIDKENIPTLFYDAWKLDRKNKKVIIDMPKARECHMNDLRLLRDNKKDEKRKTRWQVLDEKSLRAMEDGDTEGLKKIIDKKKQLRDMTTTFDLSKYKTPEDLKEAKPDYL